MRKAKPILFIFFLFLSIFGMGQDRNGIEVWADYFHYHKISGKWKFYSDAGFRFQTLNTTDDDWYRLHIRPSISFRSRSLFDLRAGMAVIYNNNDKNENPTYFEFRPWQGAKVFWPTIGKIRFENYFRLEERLTYNEITEERGFQFKGRYQVSTNIPLKNSSIVPGSYYIPVSFEVFMDLFIDGEDYRNDRLRLTGGIGYRKTEDLDILMRVILQKSPTHSGIDGVFRVTVRQNFGF